MSLNDTTYYTLDYFYKGLNRTARVGVVKGARQTTAYWFSFKVRPASFVKEASGWKYYGDEIPEALKQALIGAIEVKFNIK